MDIYPICLDDKQLISIGCDDKALPIFQAKSKILPIKIHSLPIAIANIIKQEMISAKGDAVVHRETITGKIEFSDVLLLGTVSIYRDFLRKIKIQNYPTLKEVVDKLATMLNNLQHPNMMQKTRSGKIIDYTKPVIMGILNITDDSFYDGGQYSDMDAALKHCESMINNGATIIDVGGESTRPGAMAIAIDEEIEKVVPIVTAIKKNFDIVVSVDTYKAKVAESALVAGADIINDISGLNFDSEMVSVVAKYQIPVVIMHIQGTPHDMQKKPYYDDVILELIEYFDERVDFAVKSGILRENIIIDPGIGFGKRLEDNLQILKNIQSFKKYGLPILIGVSRKSIIGAILNNQVDDRLYGTLGANILAITKGANVLRVHDVKAHFDVLQVVKSIQFV